MGLGIVLTQFAQISGSQAGAASSLTWVLGSLLLIVIGGGIVASWYGYRRYLKDLEFLKDKLQSREGDLQRLGQELHSVQIENDRLNSQLSERPDSRRQVYNIVTVGMSGCGKTALTLKWANPLCRMEQLRPTKFSSYERTVSRVHHRTGSVIEHVFEIRDWGGEQMVGAQEELVTLASIHGMLLVVDLAAQKPGERGIVNPDRIRQQIEEFSPAALKFYFGDRIISHCKTFVLFINKSDLIPGTPEEIDRKAREYYQPLIDSLMKFHKEGMVEISVVVGSANSGHNTHNLFAHFIERILPRDAYDKQLLAMLQTDSPPPIPHATQAGAQRTVHSQEMRY